MVELKDVVDEVRSLEDVLFPKDKSKCGCVALDETFIPIKSEDGTTLIGCIQRCVNCHRFVEYLCKDGCGIGATEMDESTGVPYSLLPCDTKEVVHLVRGLRRLR